MEEIAQLTQKSISGRISKRISKLKDTPKSSLSFLQFNNFENGLTMGETIKKKNINLNILNIKNKVYAKQKYKKQQANKTEVIRLKGFYSQRFKSEEVQQRISSNEEKSQRNATPIYVIWEQENQNQSLRFSENYINNQKITQKKHLVKKFVKKSEDNGFKHSRTCVIHASNPQGYEKREKRLKYSKKSLQKVFTRYFRNDASPYRSLDNVVDLMSSVLMKKLDVTKYTSFEKKHTNKMKTIT